MVRAVVPKQIYKVDIRTPIFSLSSILQGTGGIPSVTTTVGGFEMSTTECAAKVSTRLTGAEANAVLSKTVGVVALREGSTGNAAWTSEIPEGVPVMEHDTV